MCLLTGEQASRKTSRNCGKLVLLLLLLLLMADDDDDYEDDVVINSK